MSDRTGIPMDLLKVVREAVGFAEPQPEDQVREDELAVVPVIELQLSTGLRPIMIGRWLRVCADSLRRITETETDWYRTARGFAGGIGRRANYARARSTSPPRRQPDVAPFSPPRATRPVMNNSSTSTTGLRHDHVEVFGNPHRFWSPTGRRWRLWPVHFNLRWCRLRTASTVDRRASHRPSTPSPPPPRSSTPDNTRQHDQPRTSKPLQRLASLSGFDSRPPPPRRDQRKRESEGNSVEAPEPLLAFVCAGQRIAAVEGGQIVDRVPGDHEQGRACHAAQVSVLPGGDGLDHVPRIPPDAAEESRRHRVEEEQADEIQAWLVVDDPATMDRLSPIVLEDGEIDPREVGSEPRAPDDVADVKNSLILQHGEAVPDADHAGDALDPGSGEILGPDPDQRGSPGDEPRPETEEHTSELQSRENLVCRLLLEKKKKKQIYILSCKKKKKNKVKYNT